jgi:hypothetical protein
MRKERERSTHKEKVATFHALVRGGFESLVAELQAGHSERYLQYLQFLSRFHQYSPYNQMLIFLQKPDATLVAGYRQWQEWGYQVARGEKGIQILAPIVGKRKHINEKGEEVEVEHVFGFKVVHVFDISQLTQAPEGFWHKLPDDAQEQYELVLRAVEGSGIQVEEKPLPFDRQGESRGGLIYLKQGLDSRNKTHTLIHEWAHEILHWMWLPIQEARQIPADVRECQVESVSFIVSRYLGLSNPFSRDYLLHWGSTAKTLIENMEIIQKVSHYMIERLEEGVKKDVP